LLQLRANLAADISHVVPFREVKLDFELYYIIYQLDHYPFLTSTCK